MKESMIGHIVIILAIAIVIYFAINLRIVEGNLLYDNKHLIYTHKGTVGYSIKFFGSVNQYEFWYWHWLRIPWWEKFEIIKKERQLS